MVRHQLPLRQTTLLELYRFLLVGNVVASVQEIVGQVEKSWRH
jgi:hypothetical protein